MASAPATLIETGRNDSIVNTLFGLRDSGWGFPDRRHGSGNSINQRGSRRPLAARGAPASADHSHAALKIERQSPEAMPRQVMQARPLAMYYLMNGAFGLNSVTEHGEEMTLLPPQRYRPYENEITQCVVTAMRQGSRSSSGPSRDTGF